MNHAKNPSNCASNDTNKIVVFDLDETLGYFVEFGLFWNCLNTFYQTNHDHDQEEEERTQSNFNTIFDLYPEFIRPNIIGVLQYLKRKKMLNKCDKIMIYTNNQGPPSWSAQIKNYFESKINFKLFDQIIGAFKINGVRVEPGRTTNKKTHNDLLRCTQLPIHTQIFFLDDTCYPGMYHENVYCINFKPYIYKLPFETLVGRFIHAKFNLN